MDLLNDPTQMISAVGLIGIVLSFIVGWYVGYSSSKSTVKYKKYKVPF